MRTDGAGSILTMRAYETLANLNRPADESALAAEVRRLHASGLSPRDVSQALRIALPAVLNIINSHVSER